MFEFLLLFYFRLVHSFIKQRQYISIIKQYLIQYSIPTIKAFDTKTTNFHQQNSDAKSS